MLRRCKQDKEKESVTTSAFKFLQFSVFDKNFGRIAQI